MALNTLQRLICRKTQTTNQLYHGTLKNFNRFKEINYFEKLLDFHFTPDLKWDTYITLNRAQNQPSHHQKSEAGPKESPETVFLVLLIFYVKKNRKSEEEICCMHHHVYIFFMQLHWGVRLVFKKCNGIGFKWAVA